MQEIEQRGIKDLGMGKDREGEGSRALRCDMHMDQFPMMKCIYYVSHKY